MPLSSVVGAQSIIKPGVCTSSTRPASPYDGQVIYETDTDKIAVYDASAWVYKTGTAAPVAPGIVLVKTQTIGSAVSTVTVSDAFSSTYDNYRIIISGGVGSADSSISLALGATTTGYYGGCGFIRYSDAATVLRSDNNAAAWMRAGGANTNTLSLNLDVVQPFNAKPTLVFGTKVDSSTAGASGAMNGFLNNTTSYTAFTIAVDAGAMTGGTIAVYGYTKA
jgi:hypothetical protein